ncbi:MAG: hypothetical protein JJ899_14815 [Alphaproteobacteria bacterium]|nr:hypothetical protein [Alphaproteobacteria bacterium]
MMAIFSRDGRGGRELVPSRPVTEADHEEMRGWIQTLRKESAALRVQARHMNQVADDADALADRIEKVLRGI